MAEFKQIIDDALDILKFDGAVQDTLAELREKWGAQVPALLDERFDAIGIQYMKLPHEKGAAALGQELSAFGWALYNLDDEDEYLFALIPEEERNEWERYCKKQGQYCHLMKQQGRKWGDHAKEQDPGKLMPCEEYILQDEYDYFFNSLAGDFAAGAVRESRAESPIGHPVYFRIGKGLSLICPLFWFPVFDLLEHAVLIPLEGAGGGRMQQRDDVGIVVADGVEAVDPRVVGVIHVLVTLVSGGEAPAAVPVSIRLLPIAESDIAAFHRDAVGGNAAVGSIPVREQILHVLCLDMEAAVAAGGLVSSFRSASTSRVISRISSSSIISWRS